MQPPIPVLPQSNRHTLDSLAGLLVTQASEPKSLCLAAHSSPGIDGRLLLPLFIVAVIQRNSRNTERNDWRSLALMMEEKATAKKWEWPIETRKGKKTNFPLEPPEGHAAPNTLILAQ